MHATASRFALLLTFALVVGSQAHAGGKVNILVLKEHGIGSSAQAQPYVDQLVAVAAKKNGWTSAAGKYLRTRKKAKAYIAAKKPQYGILSLGAFLGMRKKQKLKVIGLADVARAGGSQYYLISKNAANLAECKGKALASDHADHPRFINKVVFGGKFSLSDFTVIKTRRPVQTIKKVARGKAVCALIDDAQLAELPHVRGATGIRSVWKSKTMPPMVIVAFPTASAAERAKFKASLSSICTGQGKSSCDKVGVKKLRGAAKRHVAKWIKAYEK